MFIKAKEACELLNIHRTTLYRWIAKYPEFPAIRIGGQWKFDKDQLLKWVNDYENKENA